MSIRDEIRNRVGEGRIVQLVPRIRGRHVRVIYLSTAISKDILGPWESPEQANRMMALRADLDHFSMGGHVLVASGRHRSCDLKHLSPLSEEVWTLRSRHKPSLRVFARFAELDVLIATNWAYRTILGRERSSEWRDERIRCKAEWKKLFPAEEPFNGSSIHEYVSAPVTDLRDLR